MQIADFVERFSRPGDEAAEVRKDKNAPNLDGYDILEPIVNKTNRDL